ncbi:MAG: glycoside hydrolase family 127 protein [Rubrivivax sp.]
MNTQEIRLGGLLGDALEASRRGRLHRFIDGPESAAIRLFDRAVVAGNVEGDWYGEHAGKWLAAAARAAARSGDDELRASVARVADFLCDQQEADGYLGTYAPSRRFMVPQPPKPPSWDGAPSVRTWDVWTHSYLILGLLEAHRQLGGNGRWLQAACRIGDLCARTLADGGIDITDLGNHFGLSATVLMDPACELYFATGDQRYLDLALRVLQQADAHAPLALLQRALAGADASEIATGKAYQLAWNLVGLAKLHRATGRADLREAVQRLWLSIREHHLTLGGGPWGGVAHRSREVFNAPGGFFPQAYVETCSTLAWLQLNRELLAISGDPQHAEEIERSAYNDLLGALAPNGEDWCYYSFANGRRVHTSYWRCCKSSGALALEALPPLALQSSGDGITLQLWTPLQATLPLGRGGARVGVEVDTRYPFEGAATLRLDPGPAPLRFTLRLRIPSWAQGATVRLRGECWQAQAGQYLAIDRTWQRGDALQVDLPMAITVHRRRHRNVQESRAPDGSAVHQAVLDLGYLALSRGPLVYATGLIDGFKTDETLRVPSASEAPESQWLQLVQTAPLPLIRLSPGYRAPLDFVPYYAAGGRADGAWRLTWLSTAPEGPVPTA